MDYKELQDYICNKVKSMSDIEILIIIRTVIDACQDKIKAKEEG